MAGDDNQEQFTKEQVEQMIAEATAGLKANRDEVLKEVKTLRGTLKNYEGVDPEEARKALQERQEAERRKEEEKGNWKALEKQLIDKYEGQLKSAYGERDEVRSAMEQYLIDSAAVAELAAHSDSPRVLLPHVKSVMRVVKDESGKYHARVIDPESGNVRVGKGQGSTPMTLTELVEEMKQDKEFAPLFRGSGSSGGGASKSSGGAASSSTIAVSNRLSMKDIDALNKGAVAVTQ